MEQLVGAAVTPAPGHGGVKNLRVWTGSLWNFDLGTYNVITLPHEGSHEVLFKELEGVKWDIIGPSEVQRTKQLFAREQKDNKEYRVGFLVNKELAGNIEHFNSLSERVAGIIIKLKKEIKFKWYRFTHQQPTMMWRYRESMKM